MHDLRYCLCHLALGAAFGRARKPLAAETGQLAFERYCASCYGMDARGTDKGTTFIHCVYQPGQHHGDVTFLLAPRRGARQHHWNIWDMKPVPGVTDDELVAITRYVRRPQKDAGLV